MVHGVRGGKAEEMLQVRAVSKSYGTKQILKSTDIVLEAGDFALLLGGNGSGKTTLFNCLTGLERYSGDIHIDPSLTREPFLPKVDALFNSGFLYPKWSYRDNLRYFVSGRTAPNDQNGDLFDVTTFGKKKVNKLSSGQQKLAELMILLKRRSAILLLDEISNGLDRGARKKVLDALTYTCSQGRAVLCTGHDLSFFEGKVNRVFALQDGTVTEVTSDYESGFGLGKIYETYVR